MLGIFKTKVTPEQFGEAVLRGAVHILGSDAGRSLGTRFPNFDGSQGWTAFLESRGVSIPLQKLYFHQYSHCAIQAAFTQAPEAMRRPMTHGAIASLTVDRHGYDFDTVYNTLDAAYFSSQSSNLEHLVNPEARHEFLPNPQASVVNARYLIGCFVVPFIEDKEPFYRDFKSYSMTMYASVGTVCRAITYASKSFKF